MWYAYGSILWIPLWKCTTLKCMNIAILVHVLYYRRLGFGGVQSCPRSGLMRTPILLKTQQELWAVIRRISISLEKYMSQLNMTNRRNWYTRQRLGELLPELTGSKVVLVIPHQSRRCGTGIPFVFLVQSLSVVKIGLTWNCPCTLPQVLVYVAPDFDQRNIVNNFPNHPLASLMSILGR